VEPVVWLGRQQGQKEEGGEVRETGENEEGAAGEEVEEEARGEG